MARRNPRTSIIWLSYDLGVHGDYDGMYAWLDSHKAKECGDSLALLSYTPKGDIAESIKAELKNAVAIDKRSRIYVIYRDHDSKKMKGTFIFGNRRSPAWSGFAEVTEKQVDEEA